MYVRGGLVKRNFAWPALAPCGLFRSPLGFEFPAIGLKHTDVPSCSDLLQEMPHVQAVRERPAKSGGLRSPRSRDIHLQVRDCLANRAFGMGTSLAGATAGLFSFDRGDWRFDSLAPNWSIVFVIRSSKSLVRSFCWVQRWLSCLARFRTCDVVIEVLFVRLSLRRCPFDRLATPLAYGFFEQLRGQPGSLSHPPSEGGESLRAQFARISFFSWILLATAAICVPWIERMWPLLLLSLVLFARSLRKLL